MSVVKKGPNGLVYIPCCQVPFYSVPVVSLMYPFLLLLLEKEDPTVPLTFL